MSIRPSSFARLCEARQRLTEIHDTPISIHEIAREARVSPYHFIRQFEALFGLTPHQFRIQSRMDHARILLARGQHSVTEVGMSSLGSFSDLFTRRMGESPVSYQRRARTLVQVPGMLPHDLFPGCFSLMGHLPIDAFRNFQEATPSLPALE